MSTPSVTILVPTYNRAGYLAESLGSLLAQTVAAERIVVIDDGSTDGTRDVALSFGRRVEYLGKANGGKSSALNMAMPMVRTDAVWIFDDDDIAQPGALEALAAGLAADPGSGFAYGSYQMFSDGPDGTRTLVDADFPTVSPERLFVALMGLSFIHQPGLMVRRRCYTAIGPFDEAMPRSQDYDMLLRLARRFVGVQVQGPLFLQRRHEGVRGTAAYSVPAARVEATWKHFDQIILGRLRDTCALEEFLPRQAKLSANIVGPPARLTRAEDFTALLERAVIVGRRGLWGLAARDLDAAIAIANADRLRRLTADQSRTLHRLFDLFSDGVEDFAAAGDFVGALRQIRQPSLARDIRAGLSRGLPYKVKLAVKAGRLRDAARLLQVYARVARLEVMALGIARRLAFARTPHQPPPPHRLPVANQNWHIRAARP